jgi:hypothetical protein
MVSMSMDHAASTFLVEKSPQGRSRDDLKPGWLLWVLFLNDE